MRSLNISLVCDGTSDFCIADIIQWFMDENFPDLSFRTIPAKDHVPAKGALTDRLSKVASDYQPDLIVCHRDAERETLATRIEQVRVAAEGVSCPVVAAVPVRMLESWLLADEKAIRCAADNSNGKSNLSLPHPSRIENLADPKCELFNALRAASGLGANRLRKFNEDRARSRITNFVQDFSSLRVQSGFMAFETSFVEAAKQVS